MKIVSGQSLKLKLSEDSTEFLNARTTLGIRTFRTDTLNKALQQNLQREPSPISSKSSDVSRNFTKPIDSNRHQRLNAFMKSKLIEESKVEADNRTLQDILESKLKAILRLKFEEWKDNVVNDISNSNLYRKRKSQRLS